MQKRLPASAHRLVAFLEERERLGLPSPSYREIAEQLGFRSTNSASELVAKLESAGIIVRDAKSARSIRLLKRTSTGIPILGAVTAGLSDATEASDSAFLELDPLIFGISRPERAFALRVRGDSMTGRHLAPGDLVILERDTPAKHNDIVAALIDRETTLKTLIIEGGRAFLRAENPAYPDLLPAEELVIQGVAKGVIRNLAA
jgi:repressor LexA